MRKIDVYKFGELPAEIQEKLIERVRERRAGDSFLPWQDETFDSLKKVFETAGVSLRDYELSTYGSRIRADLGDANDLTGARAFGWLENNLFSKLRMTRARYLARRRENFGYGYRIGAIPDCPLTGYCADHDYLEDLKKSVLNGRTLKEAFQDLAHVYEKLVSADLEQYTSESEIREFLESDDQEYTESGTEI